MKHKKITIISFLAVASLLFVFFPWSVSDLKLRIHFQELNGDNFQLFYSTHSNNVFCQEQSILAEVDKEKKQVNFSLSSTLCQQLMGLRIDFPVAQDLFGIKSITVSSAGVVQEEYNPVLFFAESNVVGSNGLEISVVPTRNVVYISTTENDPYIVLSNSLAQQISDNYSSFFETKLCIVLFFWGCYFLMKKNIFGT